MQPRRFELSDGTSNKFWEIEVVGLTFDVRFGRIGTHGQAQTKSFTSSAAAAHEAERLIREKLAKGYREVPSRSPGVVAPSPSPVPVPVPVPAPAPARAPVAATTPTVRIFAAVLPKEAVGFVTEPVSREHVDDEASPADLPTVLASPPWASSRPRKAPVLLKLTPLPSDERLDWSHMARPAVPHRATTDGDAAALRTMAKFAGSGHNFAFAFLAEMSDGLAFKTFVETEALRWADWWLGRDLLHMLARFGVPAITPILRFSHKSAELAFALEPAVSSRVAPTMAHAFARVRRGRRIAERWLGRYPEAAALGLIPQAFGGLKSERETAEKALRFLVARGHRAVVTDVARRYGAACADAIDDVFTNDGLADGAPSRAPKLPEWLDPTVLPRPRLAGADGKAVPLDAVRRLLEMLAFVDPTEPYAGLERVKEACTRASLGAFAWALFQAWQRAGCPTGDKWAFFALAWFGTDEHAHALAPIVRAWPTEGAFARAVVGLDVLGAMQSDVALMILHGISQRAKSRPLLNQAKEKIASIAEALGLSSEELADRLVPDLGLDETGARVFDFGPRRFKVGFDEHLSPFVCDEEGARLKDLPKPGTKDDPALAAAAAGEWKDLKKAARAIASQQVARFEAAMIGRRRWDAAAFGLYVVRHPLLGQLARRLVYSAFDDGGRLLGTFRIAEDGSYAGPDDGPFVLHEGAEVGVIHPLEVDASVLASWGDRFADYEIVQPFAQLAREVARGLKPDAVALGRLQTVDTLKLLGLERRGWRRGPVGDGGIIGELEKEAGAWNAALQLDTGIYAGDPKMNPTQTLGGVTFTHATQGPVDDPDPIFLAEVVADLRFVGALGLG